MALTRALCDYETFILRAIGLDAAKAIQADTEPWSAKSLGLWVHMGSCDMCRHNGWPNDTAYRAHTMGSDCWCCQYIDKHRCWMALAFDTASTDAEYGRAYL